MAEANFYDELDLRYVEIGICMERIDRTNPGSLPFIIPVLTPEWSSGSLQDNNVIQRDKSNIQNEDPGSVEVSDIQTSNYVYITIPRELCAQPDCEYYVEGFLHLRGKFDSYSALAGSGSVIEGGSINVSGTLGSFVANDTQVVYDSTLMCVPTDPWRYIDPPSKWGIIFLGGDVNMPRVICRLPDT